MGRMIFITGGVRSGKSGFAEKLLAHLEKVLYVATAAAGDDEMRRRVEIHRARRDPRWETLEASRGFGEILPRRLAGKDAMLFDCVTLMVTSVMMEAGIDWDAPRGEELGRLREEVLAETAALIEAARAFSGTSVIVSNEVGSGIVPLYSMARFFRDIAGEANQRIAASADRVCLMTAGIPLLLKGD